MTERNEVSGKVDLLVAKGRKFISVDGLLLLLYEARETGNMLNVSDLIDMLKKVKEEN